LWELLKETLANRVFLKELRARVWQLRPAFEHHYDGVSRYCYAVFPSATYRHVNRSRTGKKGEWLFAGDHTVFRVFDHIPSALEVSNIVAGRWNPTWGRELRN
jgi:hypothetical protein